MLFRSSLLWASHKSHDTENCRDFCSIQCYNTRYLFNPMLQHTIFVQSNATTHDICSIQCYNTRYSTKHLSDFRLLLIVFIGCKISQPYVSMYLLRRSPTSAERVYSCTYLTLVGSFAVCRCGENVVCSVVLTWRVTVPWAKMKLQFISE